MFSFCCLSRSTAASSCSVVSEYGSLMPRSGLVFDQVQRRVGDVDRRVVRGDLALVLGCARSNTAPHESGASVTTSVLYISRLAPQPCGMPYIWPFDRVPRLVLEERRDGRVVRHQVGVHRGDVAGVDQPQRGVAGRGHAVVLTGAHQLHHLVGGVADLDVDLAAGLLLERRHPVDRRVVGAVLGVAGPRDQVQLALAVADGAERLDLRAAPRAAAAGFARAASIRPTQRGARGEHAARCATRIGSS